MPYTQSQLLVAGNTVGQIRVLVWLQRSLAEDREVYPVLPINNR